jgi:hypothetical protein
LTGTLRSGLGLLAKESMDSDCGRREVFMRNVGAVRNVVGIRCGALSGNMKISFQAARSIG